MKLEQYGSIESRGGGSLDTARRVVGPCPQMAFYSITLSARTNNAAGISRPSALAVLRLITSSILVGCSIGISAGFSPLMMRSTKDAARYRMSATFGP